MHVHIVLCCGVKRVLFTNKLSDFGVISLIPTRLQSFIHPSIKVRELHKHACSHCSLLWCEKGIVYQQVIGMLVSYQYCLPAYQVSCIQAFW